MKKGIFLSIGMAILFSACSKSVDEKTIQKYESQLNQTIKQELSNLGENSGIKVEFSDFKCSGDKEFIVCLSPNFKTLAKDNEGEYQELFKAKNIKIRSNEVYQGEDKGTIGVKEYYNSLFKNQKNIQTSLVFENLQLGEKVASDINASLAEQDLKIRSFINELGLDFYTLSIENSVNKKENNYVDNLNIKLYSEKLNFDTILNLNLKEDLLNFLDAQGVKFNTQTLAMDEQAINEFFAMADTQASNFSNTIQKNIVLDDFKLNATLKTQGVFNGYIALAKANLENLKAQGQNEEQALILGKALSILNSITQSDDYKLNLDLKFKNIPVSDYSTQGIDSIEKLNINNQDATEALKIILPFIMISMLMGGASF